MLFPSHAVPTTRPPTLTRLRKRLSRSAPLADLPAVDGAPPRLGAGVPGLEGRAPHVLSGDHSPTAEPVVVASFARDASLVALREVRATTLEVAKDSGPRRFILAELAAPATVVAAHLRTMPGCLSADMRVARADPPENGAEEWACLNAGCPRCGRGRLLALPGLRPYRTLATASTSTSVDGDAREATPRPVSDGRASPKHSVRTGTMASMCSPSSPRT